MTVVNGTLGIELARATQPQVILMDINLPGISGIEALKILREDPATAHIPVVALSAKAMPRDIANGLELGFFRYLTKPIKVKEFMDTLNATLEFAERTVDQAQARRVHLLAAQSLAGGGIGLATEEESTQTGAHMASCTRRRARRRLAVPVAADLREITVAAGVWSGSPARRFNRELDTILEAARTKPWFHRVGAR